MASFYCNEPKNKMVEKNQENFHVINITDVYLRNNMQVFSSVHKDRFCHFKHFHLLV